MTEIHNSGNGEEGEIRSTDFSLAFTPGLQVYDESGERFRIRVVQAGELLITSGLVVACDPFWLNAAPQAYATRVPLGRFPIFISIAESLSLTNDRRVACAKLCFNTLDVVRWEMAGVADQDINTLKPDEQFCYGVDAGTGCFVDMDVVVWLFEQAGVRDLEKWRGLPSSMADTPDERGRLVDAVHTYFETSVDARLEEAWESMEAVVHATTTSPQNWGVALNDATGGNLVLFSSGWGDGCYASYFGYAADGSLACLITDFDVLLDARL